MAFAIFNSQYQPHEPSIVSYSDSLMALVCTATHPLHVLSAEGNPFRAYIDTKPLNTKHFISCLSPWVQVHGEGFTFIFALFPGEVTSLSEFDICCGSHSTVVRATIETAAGIRHASKFGIWKWGGVIPFYKENCIETANKSS